MFLRGNSFKKKFIRMSTATDTFITQSKKVKIRRSIPLAYLDAKMGKLA